MNQINGHGGVRLLSTEEVCRRLSVSRMTLHRYRDDPAMKFPHPLKLPNGRTFWKLSDIEKWVALWEPAPCDA